jgi:LuxR family transcriptional regulator, maltose regulon positive regulatory protein
VPAVPDLDALRTSIDDALERGDTTAALHAIYPAAHAIAVEEGERFRELVNSLPESLWHDDIVITSALGSSYRSAGSPRGAAALAYFQAAEKAIAASTVPVHASCTIAVLTAHAGALRTQGRLDEARAKLDEAHRMLQNEPSGTSFVRLSARHALELGVVQLHLGQLDGARHQLEYAHGLSAEHLTRSEHIECLATLALACYSVGDLGTTDLRIADVHAAAAPEHIMRSGFAAPVYAAEILVATDRQDSSRVPDLVERMVAAAFHTDWEPFASVVSAYSKSLSKEPIAALDLLNQAHKDFAQWQPAGIGLDICNLLRADVLGSLDRGEEAFAILSALNPHEHHALCPERFIARLALHHGDLRGADLALGDCELIGENHSPRTLIDVQLLRGAIELERGDLTLSDMNIDRALHAMARTGVRSPMRHIPPPLLSRLSRRALERPQSDEIRRILGLVIQATEGMVQVIEPLSERERLVLVYVERRLTVAQIATELFISPNTVKTHMRRLYRKLGVATRDEAIRKARSLGLHIDPRGEITRGSPPSRGAARDDPVL